MKISILTTLFCASAFTAAAGPIFPCFFCGNTVTMTTIAEAGAQSSTFTNNGNLNDETYKITNANAVASIDGTNSSLMGVVYAEANCPITSPNCSPTVGVPQSAIRGHLWDTVNFLTPGVAFVQVTYDVKLVNALGPESFQNDLPMSGVIQFNSKLIDNNEGDYGTCCYTSVFPVGPQMNFDIQIEANAYAVTGPMNEVQTSGSISAGISFVALDSMQKPLPNVVYTTISGQPQAISNGTWEPHIIAVFPWNEPHVPELSSDHGVIGTVTVHSPSNRLYVTMGGSSPHIEVLDLASLAAAGEVPDVNANGLAVSTQSMHGFSSSNPIVMWDVDSLRVERSIPLAANIVPGAIVLDTQNDLVYLFHQEAPLATILRASDGSTIAQITLDGIAEEAVTDGKGNIYAGMQNSDEYFVDVLDFGVNGAPAITNRWTLSGGSSCAGLAMDSANAILFATCKPTSQVLAPALWMAFQSGRLIPNSTIPVFNQAKAAAFSPDTHEVSSLQIDGTMTIIKEESPTSFSVENLIQASPIPPTSLALDSRTARLYLTGQQASSTEAAGSGLFVLGK